MSLPQHIAIIMDGNGRWAQRRGEPRYVGHKAGITPLRTTVKACSDLKIAALTVFAFSSENWHRPADEVGRLMELFVEALQAEIDELHRSGVRVRFIGNRQAFSMRLQTRMLQAEQKFQAAKTALDEFEKVTIRKEIKAAEVEICPTPKIA